MPIPIDKLTADLSAGKAGAVETFYRLYFDRLYAHARRATRRDEAFCLDVVQDAVLRILRTVRRVESEAQFEAWLRLVVRTTAYDLLKSESRRKHRELAAVSAHPSPSPSSDIDPDQRAWLKRQLDAMDPQLAKMIELRYEHRWTLARIAARFGLKTGALDGRLRRALLQLRRDIDPIPRMEDPYEP